MRFSTARGLLAAAGAVMLMAAGVADAAPTPYSGTPSAVPGTIQAENFDRGGEGVAYHDLLTGNAGGQFRTSEDVDIVASADALGGGYVVNNFQTAEWLAYTINVAASAQYDIELRASSALTGSAFHVEIDGQNLTGRVTLPNTGSWNAFQWAGKKRVSLAAGNHVMKIVSDQQYFNLNSIRVLAAPTPTPYSGTPSAVPGAIEAENFDRGGQNVAFHDKTAGNVGGQYRTSEDVDIIASADSLGGGYAVNNFQTGEWLAYTINVAASAQYDVELRASSALTGSAFHVDIDGQDVTGRITLPNTTSWNVFEWVGKKRLSLAAGRHVMKIVSDQQYFNLNSIRVLAVPVSTPTPTPYSGTPSAVPGTIEAETFDRGGQNVAFHDKTAGNVGGQYRTSEDVDIAVSADSLGGGYVVNNFETGEWLLYTINVGTSGQYDIELRTSSAFTGSAFHVEIDGQDVTGRITVPNTGNWTVFQPVGKKGVSLTAGKHLMKVVADQQYFDLNSIRFTPATASDPGAAPLFKSGFEGIATLSPLLMFGNGAWQDIIGLDSETGFAWPPKLWGGTTSRFQLIAGDGVSVTSTTLRDYMYNEIQTVTGRNGTATRALYSTVQKSVGGATVNWNSTQNDFILFPGAAGQGDLYLSYWLKFQPDLLQRMTVNSWAGRVVTDWKTGTGTGGGGDYRIILMVFGDRANNRLYWNMKGDNVANGGLPQQIFWELNNTTVPVPVGQWFRVEVFAHRSSGADGRVWVAVNGQKLFDRFGPNRGVNNLPWNRIMPFINYSSGQLLPAYQWVDDLEIWDRFPATASPH